MIPAHTMAALDRYVNLGIMPGGFLTKVLSNDLFGAVSCADSQNTLALTEVVKYIYNHVPSDAWGSYQVILDWCDRKQHDRVNVTG